MISFGNKGWIPILIALMAALPFLYFCWSKRNFIFIGIVVIVLVIGVIWVISKVKGKKKVVEVDGGEEEEEKKKVKKEKGQPPSTSF